MDRVRVPRSLHLVAPAWPHLQHPWWVSASVCHWCVTPGESGNAEAALQAGV